MEKAKLEYRNPKNVSELIHWCDTHSHIFILDNNNKICMAKVNGKVRTWKRDSNRVEIPLKYGLYLYFTFTASHINRVLIPIAR